MIAFNMRKGGGEKSTNRQTTEAQYLRFKIKKK